MGVQNRERSQSLREKGKEYEKSKLQKIEEKLEKEIAECTFKPKVNNSYKFSKPDAIQRHFKSIEDKTQFY